MAIEQLKQSVSAIAESQDPRVTALVIDLLYDDLDIIQKLDDEPNDVGGLTAAQLKAKFDQGSNTIKDYINNSLLPAISETVVEADQRAAAEAQRVSNENSRVSAENARAALEADRADCENNRNQAESQRCAAENLRTIAEEHRASAEKNRKQTEDLRQSAETERNSHEKLRASAENKRIQAESSRATAEQGRTASESSRHTNENERVAAEIQRRTAESQRAQAEALRSEAEDLRSAAEDIRNLAETQRNQNWEAQAVWEEFDFTKNYVPGNKVVYQGSSYLNLSACIGTLPDDITCWKLIASKGVDGTGAGDMVAEIYDPQGKHLDIFQYVEDRAGGDGKRTGRFVIATRTNGWTQRDCDYLCNGTDDQEVFNTALQALPDGGGEIVVLDGVYLLSAPITINQSGVTIVGNGSATVLKRNWSQKSHQGILHITADAVTVKLLCLDGNSEECNSGYAHGIYISGSNCSIQENYVKNSKTSGIYLTASTHCIISGNHLSGNSTYGIALLNSQYCPVSNNTVEDSNCAIYLYKNSYCTVSGNICTGMTSGYTLASNSCSSGTIQGNTLQTGKAAIFFYGSNHHTISGNLCIDTTEGIQLKTSSGNTVMGNHVSGSTTNAGCQIMDSACTGNLVVGNYLLGNGSLTDAGTDTISLGNQ